jgi:carbamoyl-phosphate synthase large subunit
MCTRLGKDSFFDERAIRRAAMQHGVPYITTLSGGAAVASGIAALRQNKVDVLSLQEYHEINVISEQASEGSSGSIELVFSHSFGSA